MSRPPIGSATAVDGKFGHPGRAGAPDPIRVGFVNNMPDGAFTTSENQFVTMLSGGTGCVPLSIRRYTLAGIPRAASVAALIGESYHPIRNLVSWSPDVVVITGSEPLAYTLPEEAYWSELAGIIDWALGHARSLVLSCLSAHAALLHVDGLERRRLPAKCTGVFTQSVAGRHPLADGLPTRFGLPHSRLNGVPTAEMESSGYDVLTESSIGWGIASRWTDRCLVLMMQGHPEYAADTLLREYRRDVSRYLAAKAGEYPVIPEGYLDDWSTAQVLAFQEDHRWDRDPSAVDSFPFRDIVSRLSASWSGPVARLTSNWISATAPGATVTEP